ncbi:hypothetical protein IQ07DRAFT_419101 [Pyrenochaeta sp. DS3sAY3a]|nr:hypothetical protein IQ07DRAFT_419101 [Pyrenochaeta sp. DS3sAY3a]
MRMKRLLNTVDCPSHGNVWFIDHGPKMSLKTLLSLALLYAPNPSQLLFISRRESRRVRYISRGIEILAANTSLPFPSEKYVSTPRARHPGLGLFYAQPRALLLSFLLRPAIKSSLFLPICKAPKVRWPVVARVIVMVRPVNVIPPNGQIRVLGKQQISQVFRAHSPFPAQRPPS